MFFFFWSYFIFSKSLVIADTNHNHKKRKVVWKHLQNWPFYALMLRAKLYYNPFSFIVYQNVNKRKARQWRLSMDPYFYLFMWLLSVIFSFLSRCKYNRIKICYNMLQFVKETQISTASNTERTVKLHRS